MSLPPGFQWVRRYQYAPERTAVVLGHVQVADLSQGAGSAWYARLDLHRGSTGPTRVCATLDTGRRGIELWVLRHEQRLRREVAGLRTS